MARSKEEVQWLDGIRQFRTCTRACKHTAEVSMGSEPSKARIIFEFVRGTPIHIG